jgi:hypothetical protein
MPMYKDFMKKYRPCPILYNIRAIKATLPTIMHTIDGNEFLANPGDYICRGIEDEVYPCKATVFEFKYELVVDRIKVPHWVL